MLPIISRSACVLILSAFAFLAGCSGNKAVKIASTNFGEEIQLAQNLVFRFNHDVRPEAEDSDDWEAANYVEIKPAVNGVFKWTAPNELVFSPSDKFSPATTYTAKLTKELLEDAPTDVKKKGVSSEEVTFHTPYLLPTGVQSYWDKDKSGEAVAKTTINFNYTVAQASLLPNVAVTTAGSTPTLKVVSGNTTDRPTFVLQGLSPKPEAQPMQVTLKKGIELAAGGHSLQDNKTIETSLPSATDLGILDVSTTFNKGEGILTISTTQRIDGASLVKGYTLSPAVNTVAEVVDNQLRIKGNFSPDESYTLTLLPALRGVLGGRLTDTYVQDVFFGELPPMIEFTSKKGMYLSSKGEKNVGLRLANLDEVEMKVYKIYENNIVAFAKNNRYDEYGEMGNTVTYSDDYNGTYGDEILHRKLKTKSLPSVRGISLLNVSLPVNNTLKGVYLVSVNSEANYYVNARKLISLSDIGLMAKQSSDKKEVMVFANSLLTTEPLSGIEVTLVSSNNQLMATAKTDAKGIAHFKDLTDKAPNFSAYMVTARSDDDFNFLLLPDTQVETSRFEVEGKRLTASGMDAFLYGDRSIYRPGETIHLNAVLRSDKGEKTSNYPVKISVRQPNGRELMSVLKNTNDFGAVALDVPLSRAAITGSYQVEVAGGDGSQISSQYISVEEFMPDRINVTATGKDAVQLQEGSTTIAATATNLFGPPASGRAYEMEFTLKPKPFQPKGYEQYSFTQETDFTFLPVVRQGKTDEAGVAKEVFTLDKAWADKGQLEARTFITVSDEMGRPVNRVKRQTIFTQPVFYGIATADYYVGTHVPMEIRVVGLNQQEKPVNATANVEIYRTDYQTIIEKTAEGTQYKSKKKSIPVQQQVLALKNGLATFKFVPQVSGEYEIRVRRPEGQGFTSHTFYAYGYGATSSSAFEVSNEGEVLMTFDKPTYQVGDKAKVLLNTPFSGKILVTVERQRVLEHFYVETDKKTAEVSFTITADMVPNAYVTATLVRPMKEADMPLTVAHGFASLSAEKPNTKLPITINVPHESRSKRKQVVQVSTKPNTQLTVAVVDEGILQLKNYQTPAIFEHFYRKHALEVTSHDLYALLFPELSISRLSSIGGDGYDAEKRINPLSNGRTNLVALWSGQITTGSNGKASFTIDIPQFSGDLRVMVVAYKEDAFGSATEHIKVKDPIVISSGVPRFLSPNDELVLPISLTNTTKNPTSAAAKVTTSGGLVVAEGSQQSVQLAAGKEQQLVARIKAPAQIGNATIKVAINAFGETFTEDINVTVRPSASLLKTSAAGSVLAGQSQALPASPDFMAGTARTQILLSKSPLVQYANSLDYLLEYPHGCVEQTISKAFPQLYFADFAQLLGSKKFRAAGDSDWNPRQNVQAAIGKIEAMQLPNGSLAYWPGSTDENWWSSAYGLHFLLEARKAGYEVNEGSTERLANYLASAVASKEQTSQERYYAESGEMISRTIARREAIYSLYVLALQGSPNQSVMSYFRENAKLLTPDSRYLLAAAYKQLGNDQAYTALLPKKYTASSTVRELDGSFASPLRNLALSLNTLLETEPNNLQIPAMAKQLSDAVKATPQLTTQEAAFAFLALGKVAKKANQSDITGSLLANGKVIQTLKNGEVIVDKGLEGKALQVTAQGRGSLYYFLQHEGISATGNYVEEDNLLRVRRQYLSRTGQPVANNQLIANQLVVVKISVSSLSGVAVPNVVITDMLPAAFEIENPRLNEARDFPWLKNASTPRHFDIRDDRLNLYTDLGSTEQHFYYLVRIVSKGKFTLGPVSADAMYDATYRSYHGGGVVEVR